jgi:hypothetical protein
MTNAQIRHLRALISAGLLDFGCQKTLGNEEAVWQRARVF